VHQFQQRVRDGGHDGTVVRVTGLFQYVERRRGGVPARGTKPNNRVASDILDAFLRLSDFVSLAFAIEIAEALNVVLCVICDLMSRLRSCPNDTAYCLATSKVLADNEQRCPDIELVQQLKEPWNSVCVDDVIRLTN
jgi:hypothetical protein